MKEGNRNILIQSQLYSNKYNIWYFLNYHYFGLLEKKKPTLQTNKKPWSKNKLIDLHVPL